MIPTYASFRPKPNASDFSVDAIAGTASVIERNFYVQFANRAGRSQLQYIGTTESSGTEITIANGAILSAEEVFWIVISVETTGQAEDAGIIYQWQARDNDQETRRSLPLVLNLTTEFNLTATRTVQSTSDLSSITGINPGAIAFAVDTGKYYRYDPESITSNNYGSSPVILSYGAIAKGIGKWIEYDGSFAANVEVGGVGSCDRVIRTVPSALKIPPKSGAGSSLALRYWLNNGYETDGLSPIENARYTFDVKVNGVPGYNGLFADRITYRLIGYVDRATALLSPTPAQQAVKRWNPNVGLLELPQALPRGHAAVYDIALDLNNEDLIGKLPSKLSEIELDIVEVSNIQSVVSEVGKVIGDLVFADRDRFLITSGGMRLPGVASFAEGYLAEDANQQIFTGLVADTANQQVIISGSLNGYCTVRQSGYVLQYGEKLRAVVSTISGDGFPVHSPVINVINKNLTIEVFHPIVSGLGVVRADYPDAAIAGNNKGLFTPIKYRVWVVLNGVIYAKNTLSTLTPQNPSQSLTITDLTDYTVVTAIPTPVDLYTGLFKPDNVTISDAGTGTISGAVQVAIAYSYPSQNYQITKIKHYGDGVMPTANKSLAAAINDSLLRSQNLNDLPDKAIARTNLDVYSKSQAATTTALATTNTNVATNTTAIATNTASINALGTKSKVITANYTVQTSDHKTIIEVNSDTDITITLDQSVLNLASINGTFELIIRKINPGNVTIAVPNGTTLEGSGTKIQSLYQAVYFAYKFAGKWIAIGNLTN